MDNKLVAQWPDELNVRMNEFNYPELVAEYQEWIDRELRSPETSACLKQLEKLREGVASNDPESWVEVPLNLGYVGEWYARAGVVEIAGGSTEGWRTLKKAFLYRAWETKIYCLLYDRATNKWKATRQSSEKVGSRYLLGMALGEWELSGWLGGRLEQSLTDESVNWANDLATPGLALALHRILKGSDDPCRTGAGVYNDIFLNWENRAGLELALGRAADYHVEVRTFQGDEDPNEFAVPPHDIWAVEIQAIYGVRERLGLETPKIVHPLMNTPFGNAPREIESVKDELLEAAVGKVRAVIPEL